MGKRGKLRADSERTAWHVMFERLVMQRAPHSIEVLSEVPLGRSRPQLDLLFLRRKRGPRADRDARVLRGLWRHVGEVMILEFKSISRPIRPGDLLRHLAYAALYTSESRKGNAEGVRLGLVVASVTPTLTTELQTLGGTLPTRRGGYTLIRLHPFDLVLAVVDEVAMNERDELLGSFGHGEVHDVGDRLWWKKEAGRAMPILRDLPDYDRVFKKALRELPPKVRMEGLTPEERMVGLVAEERLAGLKADGLKGVIAAAQRQLQKPRGAARSSLKRARRGARRPGAKRSPSKA